MTLGWPHAFSLLRRPLKGNKSDVRGLEAVGELKGIRFALASEIDSSYRISDALLKRLTGVDTL